MVFEIDFPNQFRAYIVYYCIPLLFFDFYFRFNERLKIKVPIYLELLISIILIISVILFSNQSSGFIYFQF